MENTREKHAHYKERSPGNGISELLAVETSVLPTSATVWPQINMCD